MNATFTLDGAKPVVRIELKQGSVEENVYVFMNKILIGFFRARTGSFVTELLVKKEIEDLAAAGVSIEKGRIKVEEE